MSDRSTLAATLRAAGYSGKGLAAALALHQEQPVLNGAVCGSLQIHFGDGGVTLERHYRGRAHKTQELEVYGESIVV